jgi:hypothetical protein
VDTIFTGKEQPQFNRRFLSLANHYLFEPVACTSESGWDKGQIENQVGNIRKWLFTPTPSFQDLTSLNAWLAQRCDELAGRANPGQPSRTIADCFAEEQALLMPVTAVFDAYVERTLRASSTATATVCQRCGQTEWYRCV